MAWVNSGPIDACPGFWERLDYLSVPVRETKTSRRLKLPSTVLVHMPRQGQVYFGAVSRSRCHHLSTPLLPLFPVGTTAKVSRIFRREMRERGSYQLPIGLCPYSIQGDGLLLTILDVGTYPSRHLGPVVGTARPLELCTQNLNRQIAILRHRSAYSFTIDKVRKAIIATPNGIHCDFVVRWSRAINNCSYLPWRVNEHVASQAMLKFGVICSPSDVVIFYSGPWWAQSSVL